MRGSLSVCHGQATQRILGWFLAVACAYLCKTKLAFVVKSVPIESFEAVSRFDRANGLSIFHFDAVQFIDASAKDFDLWVQWIRDSCFVFNFWKSKTKIYVGVDAIVVSIWVLKRVDRSQLFRLFNDGSDNTALLSWFLLRSGLLRLGPEIESVRDFQSKFKTISS